MLLKGLLRGLKKESAVKDNMSKRNVFIELHKHGWPQTQIANRFNVSVPYICTIIATYRESLAKDMDLRCEMCDSIAKELETLMFDGVKPFSLCKKCKKLLEKH